MEPSTGTNPIGGPAFRYKSASRPTVGLAGFPLQSGLYHQRFVPGHHYHAVQLLSINHLLANHFYHEK